MHRSSMNNMTAFVEEHLDNKSGVVVDVGSLDINGSYRELFDEDWEYIGIDIVEGKNVDLVLSDPYNWRTFSDKYIDVIISGQCFEHIEYPEKTMSEIARVLKVGGLACIIAPSGGDPEHGLKKFYVKDFEQLATDVGLKVLSCRIDNDPEWNDCVLIAKKTEQIKSDTVKSGVRPKKT